MNLNFSDTLSSGPMGSELSAPSLGLETVHTPQGSRFGQVLDDMHSLHTEQADPLLDTASVTPVQIDGPSMAETTLASTALTTTAWPLREVKLGPNLNAITPSNAAPDLQSLEAFARAQGLDEKAVKWLFATPVATAASLAQPGSALASSPAPEDGVPINLLRMPPPAAVWIQRNLMSGVTHINNAAQKGPDISESELDLGADWDPDTLSNLLGKDSGSTTATGSSATGTHSSAYANFAARWDAQATARADLGQAGSAAAAEPSSAAARSENIQNLAEKMGQAVGQRMLSEMEKGQWHLKLQLRPATLGHIEVEMRMRSGEFDAVFTAPNATTRDLLQDGMAKLKETLAQMGMDVASVYVGNGQTGQSGGDSTPRSPHNTALSAGASAQETDSESNHRAPLVKTPKEGLDVLV